MTSIGAVMSTPARAADSPEAFAAFQKAEIAKWVKVVKEANVKVEQ